MNTFEIITLVFSFSALLISIISITFSHKNSKKQFALEEKQAELAATQLQQINEEDKIKNKAYLQVSIEGYSSSYKIFIRNISYVSAFNIDIKIIPGDGKRSPYIQADYDKLFPFKQLDPMNEIFLVCHLDSGTGYEFDSFCSWINPDNSKDEKETHLSSD